MRANIASLLVTTMLVAAPALAQTTGNQSTPTAPTTTPIAPAPSGTAQKAAPHSNRSAMARQPGETMQTWPNAASPTCTAGCTSRPSRASSGTSSPR